MEELCLDALLDISIQMILDDINIKDCLIYQGYSVHVRKVCEFIAKYIKSV